MKVLPVAPSLSLGFCWVFPDVAPEEGLGRLKDAGFDGIELWPDRLRQWGAVRWAAALEKTGMRCLQLCPYFNFMNGRASLEASRADLGGFLEAARIVGCLRLRVFTGPPWGDGVVGARDATERQWSDAIAGLREFCDRAATEGVELCLECHEGSLMEDAPSTLRILREVGRPNLAVNLQLPLRDEPWTASLAALAAATTHIHIHNWTQGLGEGSLTFLGEGAFDWRPVVRTILAARPGPLTLSVEHPDHGGLHDPWETARRDGAWLTRLRDGLGER